MSTYTARRLPRHLGPAAWNEILPPLPTPRSLQSDMTADFTIIGAGFAGLSAARRLRQLHPNAVIAVLDAGRIAEGAAGRNSGFMIDLPHELTSHDYAGQGDDAAQIALNRQAIAFARSAVEEYGIDPNYFDPAGKVNGAASQAAHAHNESFSQHLNALGEPHEMLDARQMTEMTGSRYYHAGLYTPGTVMLQPAGYMRGLADGLRKAGVDIYEQSPADAFQRTGKTWTVRSGGHRVNTGRVVLTVNGHLESFGIARGRLIQLFLFAAMSENLPPQTLAQLGGQPRWGITPSNPMGTTIRRIDTGQGGNRIITRTAAVMRQNMSPRRADLDRAARLMRHKFDARFPNLADVRMTHVWAGHLCLSLNGVAVTGEIETGVFSGCVQNGLGTARGTLTGIAAAELAAGEASAITRHFLAEDAPKRLPPRPFRQIGGNLMLRWREHIARSE